MPSNAFSNALKHKADAEGLTDGLSLTFPDWRFNLRASNTEPLLRLNVETLGDREKLAYHVKQVAALID